jgi:hypothetical protein
MSECEPLPMAAINREKTACRAPCGMVGKTTHSLVTTFYTYLHPTPIAPKIWRQSNVG